MSIPTPAQLQLLETRPQRTKLWLSIYQPSTLLACRVNDASIRKESRQITYDSVTEGFWSTIQPGTTMYVGSVLGAADKGRVRVRSATASKIVVAENSDIDWEDGDYLTVVSFYELWPVYPRNVKDSSSELNILFYKDYDISYTDQNDINGCFICMEPNYAGFLDGGSELVYYSASGTSHVNDGETPTSYSWFFEGATVTGSSLHTPGYITYDTPGHYMTRLIVSGSNGSRDVSHRHVSIYDRPGYGDDVPILNWKMDSLTGSRDDGGYTTTITIRENVSNSIVRDGALVVIFADDWYGATKQSVGGNALNRDSTVFVGYILNNSITYNYADSSVSFDVGSPSEILKISETFSIEVDDADNPVDPRAGPIQLPPWSIMSSMTSKKALWYYLHWHTTCTNVMDIEFDVENDYPIRDFTADRSSIYDAINTHMDETLAGNAVFDRQGKLWFEVGARGIENADTALPTALVLNKDKWADEPEIIQIKSQPLSYLEMGGIAYSGTTGTFSALLSGAPGVTRDYQIIPSYKGSPANLQGLALRGQRQLNQLCGNVFAWINAQYPEVNIPLSGNYRIIDIAPQELLSLNVGVDDTHRGIVWINKKFSPQEIIMNYYPTGEQLRYFVNCHEITDGTNGDTMIISDMPDGEGYDGGEPWPPWGLNDFPPFDFDKNANDTIVRNSPYRGGAVSFPSIKLSDNINSAKEIIFPSTVKVFSGNYSGFVAAVSSPKYFFFSYRDGADFYVARGNYTGGYTPIQLDYAIISSLIYVNDSSCAVVIQNTASGDYDLVVANFDAGTTTTVFSRNYSLYPNTLTFDGALVTVPMQSSWVAVMGFYELDSVTGYGIRMRYEMFNLTTDQHWGTVFTPIASRFPHDTPYVTISPAIVGSTVVFPMYSHYDPDGVNLLMAMFHTVDVGGKTAKTYTFISTDDLDIYGVKANFISQTIYYSLDSSGICSYGRYNPAMNTLSTLVSTGNTTSQFLGSTGKVYNKKTTSNTLVQIPATSSISIPNSDSLLHLVGLCEVIDENENRVWKFDEFSKTIRGYLLSDVSDIRIIDVSSVVTIPPGASNRYALDLQGNRFFLTITDITFNTLDLYVIT